MRKLQWLAIGSLLAIVLACGGVPNDVNLVQVSGNNQTTAANGSPANPLMVKALDINGKAQANIPLSATSDVRFCSVSPTSTKTGSDGTASFTVTASSASSVSCNVTVTISGSQASNIATTFSVLIRAAQKTLSPPASVAMPSVNATLTNGGTPSITFTAGLSSLPPLDANHAYFVYLMVVDPTGNTASSINYAGKISGAPATFTQASTIANFGTSNAIALVLQPINSVPIPTGAANVNGTSAAFQSPVVVATYTALGGGGTASPTLVVPSAGVSNNAAFAVSPGATGIATLSNSGPALLAGYTGDTINVVVNGLYGNPSSYRYIAYRSDASNTVTRMATLSTNAATGSTSFFYTLPPVSNGSTQSSSDLSAAFNRIFITLEPLSPADGTPPSSGPGNTVVLDSGATAFVY